MLNQAITFPGISLNPFQRFARTVQYSTVQVPTKLEYERKTKGVEIDMNLGMCLPEEINTEKQDKFICRPADPDDRSVYGVDLQPLDYLDRGFESR